jgi:hypothetical protein
MNSIGTRSTRFSPRQSRLMEQWLLSFARILKLVLAQNSGCLLLRSSASSRKLKA